MRVIKFRGKRIDNGEWWYGDLITDLNVVTKETVKTYIHNPVKHVRSIDGLKTSEVLLYEVIPETVRQFTGLCDMNGKEVWGGDIVQGFIDGEFKVGVIEFTINNQQTMISNWHGGFAGLPITDLDYLTRKIFEVIGNIHDNPELLGGAQ